MTLAKHRDLLRLVDLAGHFTDRALAIFVGLLATLIAVGLIRYGGIIGQMITYPLSLVPCIFLWRSGFRNHLFLALVALPVSCGAYTICDIEPSGATWGILHEVHPRMTLLIPYALIRAVWIAVTHRSLNPPLDS